MTAVRPLPRNQALLGMVLSGVLYALAFPGLDMWPLGFLAFAPAYLSLRGQPVKRAAWFGLLWGFVTVWIGFYWLNTMLKTFSGFPTLLCALFTSIVVAYQGGRFALLAWFANRAGNRGWPYAPSFIAAFVASELVYPLLFPWYTGAFAHKTPIFIQTADLGGPILVGLLFVVVGVAIAEPVAARLDQRRVDRRILYAAGGGLAFTVLYGFVRIAMVESAIAGADKATVGLVQGNMGLMQKREDPGEGLRRHKRLTKELRDKGADLVVWSESSVTFAVPESMAKTFMHDRIAGQVGVPLIFGGVVFRTDPDRERWYNTAIATDAKGDITSRYDKQYLLAFGEYLPFGESFPILYKWSPNSGKFSAGKSLEPLRLSIKGKERAITTLICYEDILPGFTRDAVNAGKPELLVNITNDAWFGDTTEPWAHLALAKLRAIEHRRYLVRATNSGVSAIVDPIGRSVVETKTFVAASASTEIAFLSPSRTPYEILGNAPWYLVLLGVLYASFRSKPEKKTAAG